MNCHLPYFNDLKNDLTRYAMSFRRQGHRGLISSSTSGTVTSIFGEACRDLTSFDPFLSLDEVTLLKSRHHISPNLDLVQGEEWSFLHATSILEDTATSLKVITS
jgi:hypothetical protein